VTNQLDRDITTALERIAAHAPEAGLTPRESLVSPDESSRPLPILAAACVLAGAVAVAVVVGLVAANHEEGITTTVAPASQPQDTATDPVFVFRTPQVAFTADTVTIEVGGRTFSPVGDVAVQGLTGEWQRDATIELEWFEQGVGMRLYAYLHSDGVEWWADELRTADGSTGGQWAFYRGDFFRSPLGQPWIGDLDVTAGEDGVTGRLQITGLELEAFVRPPACDEPGALALQPATTVLHFAGGYGLLVTLFDTATCAPVAAPDDYDYEWTSADPDVVSVVGDGARGDLGRLQPGETTVNVVARDRATGAVVAETEIVLRDPVGTVESTLPTAG
jgi:hypothetical protein